MSSLPSRLALRRRVRRIWPAVWRVVFSQPQRASSIDRRIHLDKEKHPESRSPRELRRMTTRRSSMKIHGRASPPATSSERGVSGISRSPLSRTLHSSRDRSLKSERESDRYRTPRDWNILRSHLQSQIRVYEDVPRGEISVRDALSLQMFHPSGNLYRESEELVTLESDIRLLAHRRHVDVVVGFERVRCRRGRGFASQGRVDS